jgi:hypothetical protein
MLKCYYDWLRLQRVSRVLRRYACIAVCHQLCSAHGGPLVCSLSSAILNYNKISHFYERALLLLEVPAFEPTMHLRFCFKRR